MASVTLSKSSARDDFVLSTAVYMLGMAIVTVTRWRTIVLTIVTGLNRGIAYTLA